MSAKKNKILLGAFCAVVAVAATSVAQNDLDSLLSDLESGSNAKPAAAAPAKPAPAPVAEEKPAEKSAEAPAAVAEEKPAEKPAEAPAAVAEEKPAEKPAEAPAAVAEEKPAEKPAEAPAAVAEEKPAEKPAEAPAAVAEEKPAEKPAEAPAAVAEKKPVVAVNPEQELISDIANTERLRRMALDAQAQKEIAAARAAMDDREYDEAARFYQLAKGHLNDRPDSAEFRRECDSGVAEAYYQAGKKAFKEGNREEAKAYAEKAITWRHPRAKALLDALSAERTQVAEKDFSEIKHRRNDQDYKEDRTRMRKRLRLAAQYLTVGDLDGALEQCDLVLRTDPYNQEAIALRERIQRRREVIIGKEREATRKGMIADIGAAWRPVYAVNSTELKETDGGTSQTPVGSDPERSAEQSIEKRMKEMMLPAISFKPPATIIDAVDYFRQASKDFDRPEIPVEQRGFNFVLDLGKPLTGAAEEKADDTKADDNSFASSSEGEAAAASGDVPQIPNISASNVTLWDAMKLVCKISGFKFKVQGPVVMVMPKDMSTDELVTRSYNVVESFLDRMNNASSDLKDQKAGSFGGGEEKEGGDEGGNQEADWKNFFKMMGVSWPKNSAITYIKTIGKLRVTNTADQLAILEQALNELNVTPMLIEIETRFVEVAQEDLNSLGFEWLLNSDYSLNLGHNLSKALGIKNGQWDTAAGETVADTTTTMDSTVTKTWNGTSWVQSDGTQTTTANTTYSTASGAGRTWTKGATGADGNIGVNAIDGTSYSTGMRYLSTEGNHISGEGASANDKFMRVNAFLGNADISMILHMLSQRSDTDLLSAPKVVTKSGQEATIKVVTIYRYPQDYDVTIQSTSSGSGSSSSSSSGGGDGKILPMVEPQNFTDMDVGVTLTVTPDVSAEGQLINLDLKPKIVSEPTWKDYGMKVPMSVVESSSINASFANSERWFTVPMEQPFFKERSIETHVSIYNGATVVMGGLITEERKSMEDKIPFLGDIPYLGRFFRSRSEWSDKRNLLLFVTARLVDPRGRQMSLGTGDDTGKTAAAPTAAPVTPAPEAKQ